MSKKQICPRSGLHSVNVPHKMPMSVFGTVGESEKLSCDEPSSLLPYTVRRKRRYLLPGSISCYHLMLSHIFFRNLFRIFTKFIGTVQRIPYLRKERIHFCAIAVVPALPFALVAPVTTLQDKPRAGSEFMPESTLKFQLAAPVALVHFCAEQPAAYPQCQVRFPAWFRHSHGLSEQLRPSL